MTDASSGASAAGVGWVCDGGPRRRIMYLETVDSAISNPTLSDARGAPQWVLLAHPLDEFAQLMANSVPPWATARFPSPIGPDFAYRSGPEEDWGRAS
jgi:hypothetical protein